ncbi:MAG: mechanosensitive ion channel family protein [Thermoplasmata archaeon]
MDKRRWLVLPFLLLTALMFQGCMDAAGSDENLNVFNRTPLTQEAHYPDASHFEFVIVNNNTMNYYIVNISSDVKDAVFSPSDNHFVVEPKTVREIKVEIKPYKRVSKNEFNITFEIRNAVNMSQVHVFEYNLKINYVGVVSTEKVLGIFENILPYPFNNLYGVFILDIILWTLLIIVVYYITEKIVTRLVKRTKTDLDDRILAIVRKPLLVFFITYAIVSSTEILDLPDVFYFYLYNFYWSVVILLFGYMAYKLWKDVVIYFFRQVAQKTETEIDDILVPVFDKVGGAIIVIVILIYFVNKVFSVDVTLLVASMGVLGLIIGFAAQDSLSNFFSGILLLLDRPFVEGDIVTLGDSDKWYRVEKIGLRSTRFYSIFDDVMVVIPNNKISSERIVNMVEPEETLRGRVEFSVSYGSDPRKVLKVAEEVALSHPDILKDKKNAPVVRFRNFGESSLDFAIFFVVKNYNLKYKVESEIRTNLFERFKKEGIEIPFPQLDVHIKNGKGG